MKDTFKMLFNEDVKLDAELIWQELFKNNFVFEELLVDNKKNYRYRGTFINLNNV
jgi:hypothetical protein